MIKEMFKIMIIAKIIIQNEIKEMVMIQASTLTQTVTGPVGPLKPRIYWSYKIFTGPKKIFNIKGKNIA